MSVPECATERRHPTELRLVALCAPRRMVAGLLPPPGIPAGGLQVALCVAADPHVVPGRWDGERPDPGNRRRVADRRAPRVHVVEAPSRTATRDPWFRVGRISKLGIGNEPRQVRDTGHQGVLHPKRAGHGSLAIVVLAWIRIRPIGPCGRGNRTSSRRLPTLSLSHGLAGAVPAASFPLGKPASLLAPTTGLSHARNGEIAGRPCSLLPPGGPVLHAPRRGDPMTDRHDMAGSRRDTLAR